MQRKLGSGVSDTQSNRGFHEAMLAVRDQVSSGSSLADAMGRERGIFDEMTIGMIRVGEHAGNLDEVCEQVAAFRERSGELKDRVLTALLYPAIVMTVSVGVTIFLMTVVVPMLLKNLTEIGRPLPLPTLVLKYLSDVLLEHGHWLGFGLFCLSVAIFLAAKSERGQKMIDRLSFSTPVLGSLIQKQALSRMSLVVSSLLRSGVELVDALEIAQKSTTNGLLQSALIEMQGDLRAGKDLRDSTSRQSFFTHSMAQVFSLGQQSGQLDSMLLRLECVRECIFVQPHSESARRSNPLCLLASRPQRKYDPALQFETRQRPSGALAPNLNTIGHCPGNDYWVAVKALRQP